MIFVPERLPSVLVGVVLCALAVWLLVLDPRRRVHRALALFLVLRAVYVGLAAFTLGATDLLGRVRVYYILVLPFAGLWLAYAYSSDVARHLPPLSLIHI